MTWRMRKWGIGWSLLFVLFLPVALGLFLVGFDVAGPSSPLYWLALVLMLGIDALALAKAASLGPMQIAGARGWLILAPFAAAGVLLTFFGERALGPGGVLIDRPWSFAWVTQLLVGLGWTSLWLPRDFDEPLPAGVDGRNS
jgi:hypothetical protein